MKIYGGTASSGIKLFLVFFALLIGGATLYYTNFLVQKLQAKEREIVQLYAKGIEYVSNSTGDGSDMTFLFDNIIRPIDFPLILTDKDNKVSLAARSDIRNIVFDTTKTPKELEEFFQTRLIEMDAEHKPIDVRYIAGNDTIILNRIHYGESELIRQLRFFPYIQMAIATAFILIGYVSFTQIKKSEQSNIWVGMAKETAHQFGTPISSLLGWIELLKMNFRDPDKVLDTAEEIGNDVQRMEKITNRFSKIGSKPELKNENVYDTTQKVVSYFERRIPQTGKNVILSLDGDANLSTKLNADLFEWVLENLIKNALDAIEHKDGKIGISINRIKKKIEVEVADNGKGIDLNRRKDVFRPGYSTKRRGWGLGLSLSKRIIEEYHHGKIYVKTSGLNQGTVFKIILKS